MRRQRLFLPAAVLLMLGLALPGAGQLGAGRHLASFIRQTPGSVTSLTIQSSPDPSIAAAPVVVSGEASGSAVTGVTVTLWTRFPDQSQFHRSLSTQTDSEGNYTFSIPAGRVETNRDWYVSIGTVDSVVIAQRVRARVTASASDPLPAPGERLSFTGTVFPAHGGDGSASSVGVASAGTPSPRGC